MAIASLSTQSTNLFRGGRHLTPEGSSDLVGVINTVIAKVNEIIAGIGTSDTLSAGSGTGNYYGGNDSWMEIDGTNPPTVSALRIQDQLDGSYCSATINNKTWVLA